MAVKGFYSEYLPLLMSTVERYMLAGKDVTKSLVARAVRLKRRSRRDIHDNSMSTFNDPRSILLNDKAIPPSVQAFAIYRF